MKSLVITFAVIVLNLPLFAIQGGEKADSLPMNDLIEIPEAIESLSICEIALMNGATECHVDETEISELDLRGLIPIEEEEEEVRASVSVGVHKTQGRRAF